MLYILYEPAGHPKYGLVAGTWMNFKMLEGDYTKVLRLSHSLPFTHLPQGLLLSGRATENYFHWMIEYLPRLLNVIQTDLPKNIPLIVKKGLPKQFYSALDAINPGYPIFKVDLKNQYLAVDQLYIPSFQTSLADSFDVPFWRGAGISNAHILFVRDQTYKAFKIPDFKPEQLTRKIYLARRSSRTIQNAFLLQRYLVSKGFEIVYPEKLSFEDQVRLFSTAKIVVGPTGAAMANIIFMQPGSQVIGLISERYQDYAIKSVLAELVGASFTYVTGKNIYNRKKFEQESEYAQSNFKIDFRKFKNCINEALRKKSMISRNEIHSTVVIEGDVRLGKNNKILPYSVLIGPLVIGDNNIIGPHAVIGSPGQDTRNPRYDTSNCKIEIGNDNIIREFTACFKNLAIARSQNSGTIFT